MAGAWRSLRRITRTACTKESRSGSVSASARFMHETTGRKVRHDETIELLANEIRCLAAQDEYTNEVGKWSA
jgi:hypothetical protein